MKICALVVKLLNKEKIQNIKFSIEHEILNKINSGFLYFMITIYSEEEVVLAEILVNIRKRYPDIHILAVVPTSYYFFKEYNKYKIRIENIISNCSAVDTIGEWGKSANKNKIDEFLIRNCSDVIIITKANYEKRLWIYSASDLYKKNKVVIKI